MSRFRIESRHVLNNFPVSFSFPFPLVTAQRGTPSACSFHGISTIETLADSLRGGAYRRAVTNDGFSKEFVVLVGAIDVIHTFPHTVHRICWLASLSMGRSNLRATPQIQRPNRIDSHRQVKVLRRLDLGVLASFPIPPSLPTFDGDGESLRPGRHLFHIGFKQRKIPTTGLFDFDDNFIVNVHHDRVSLLVYPDHGFGQNIT